jgi:hypothetical protein
MSVRSGHGHLPGSAWAQRVEALFSPAPSTGGG